MMKFTSASVCEAGGRGVNQDFHGSLYFDAGACWVLADGLGGHRGGEIASQTAVEKILESYRERQYFSPESIRQYLNAAQESILNIQEENPEFCSIQSTVVLLLTDCHSALWGHVGDSRLYFFRAGSIISQTKDHSVSQAMVAAGEILPKDIRNHEDRSRLLRSLGKKGEVQATIIEQKQAVQPGDAFLLCSDGFWEYVTETEMEVDYASVNCPEDWLRRMEQKILKRARGEFDNYCAIAVFVEAE